MRISGLDRTDGAAEYQYEIRNMSSDDWMMAAPDHINVSEDKKDIIVSASTHGDGSSDFKFTIKRSDGTMNENDELVYQPVSGAVAKVYFQNEMPLVYIPDEKGFYTISESDKIGGDFCLKIKGLEPDSNYVLVDENNTVISADIQKNTKNERIVRVGGIPHDLTFKIMKQSGKVLTDLTETPEVGKYSEELVTKDDNSVNIRMEYYPADAKNDVVKTDTYGEHIGYGDKEYTYQNGFTIPAADAFNGKFTILVKDLPEGYTISDGNATVEPRKSGDGKVDLYIEKTADTSDFTFTVIPPAGTALPANLTAVRFFMADANGIVNLPKEAMTAISEHLAYGVNKEGNDKDNGVFKKYHYTVVECDKAGTDDQSTLTYQQSDVSASGDQATARKLTFTLNTSSYHPVGQTPRKYMNIMVVDQSNSDHVVKKDIDGNALKLTMKSVDEDGTEIINDYYASDVAGNIPNEGIFVIPLPTYCDSVECTIDGLPYRYVDGTDGDPDYTVKRCKASGAVHSEQLTFTAEPTVTESQFKKTSVSFSYEKTWNENAKNETTRPEKVYFALFRKYSEFNEEKTEFVKEITMDVTSDSVKDDDSTLPSGKWVKAGNSETQPEIWIWAPYTYYLKEYYSEYNTEGTENDEKSYNSLYQSSHTYKTDQPFELVGYTYAKLDQGLKNKLQKTRHEVIKVWDDENNTSDSRKTYTIQLQRTTGGDQWENVDLRNVILMNVTEVTEGTGTDEKIRKVYSRVSLPHDAEIMQYTVPYDSASPNKCLHYCFDGLPIYDESGLTYSYRVVETMIGTNAVNPTETYLFFVPGTESTDDEYSYVRSIRRGTKDYYVDFEEGTGYDYTTPEGAAYQTYSGDPKAESFTKTTIKNSLVTDIVSFTNFKATKTWNDENNLYGKRPSSITFTLKRTITSPDGVTKQDNSFKNEKQGDEANNWTAEWKQCAAFAPDGSKFTYYVEEESVPYYTEELTKTEKADTMVYDFTNTYEPKLI